LLGTKTKFEDILKDKNHFIIDYLVFETFPFNWFTLCVFSFHVSCCNFHNFFSGFIWLLILWTILSTRFLNTDVTNSDVIFWKYREYIR